MLIASPFVLFDRIAGSPILLALPWHYARFLHRGRPPSLVYALWEWALGMGPLSAALAPSFSVPCGCSHCCCARGVPPLQELLGHVRRREGSSAARSARMPESRLRLVGGPT